MAMVDDLAFPDLLEQLVERLELQESLDLEFKECRTQLSKEIWPTVSAFANTSGGWLVLGVAEQNERFVVTGLINAPRLLQQLTNMLRNPQKISSEPCGPYDVQIHAVGDVKVIVARIQGAPVRERPIYINGNPYEGTFLRRNSGDFRATKAEVDRMMRDASGVSADSSVLPEMGLEDLDLPTLDRYRRRHLTSHPASPRNGYDDQRFLSAIEGYGRDAETGREGLTVAGLLMFGTPESIRKWRHRHLIDFRLEEIGSSERWDDRLACEDNLFTAFERIYPRLTYDLPMPFQLDGPYRVAEGPLHIALREALVNLLVHADYAETGASLIRRSPQRFLFRNPGSSRVSQADLLSDDRSDPRNPALVRMFRIIGLADEAGTGMAKIFAAWRDSDLKLPAIDAGGERYEFTLALEYIHMLSEEDCEWLLTIGGTWNKDERLALICAHRESEVDNATLRSLTGQHASDATRTLLGLRNAGYLEMQGTRRGARYRLGPRAAVVKNVTHFPTNDPSLPTNDLSLHRSDPNLQGTDTSSLQGTDTSSLQGTGTNSVDDRLMAIAGPIRAMKRMPASQTERIIRDLCTVRPLTRNEIAQWIDRSGPYTGDLVRLLVNRGTLAMTNPDRPNDPNQRYRAIPDPGDRQGTVDG